MAIRHILYATDFSDPAQYAARHAAAVARETGARITILHSLMPPLPSPHVEPRRWLDEARKLAEDEAARAREALEALSRQEEFRGLRVGTRLVAGLVEYQILHAVTDLGIDLAVMGTHGRGMVGRALLGGVTTKVVRLSPCPVLAVRWPGARTRTPWGTVLVGPTLPPGGPGFGHILVPLDGSPLAEAVLLEVRELARAFGSGLTLVRAIERPKYPMVDAALVQAREADEVGRYLDRLRAGLETEGFPVTTEMLFGDPARAILEHAAKVEADLIAMSTHGRSGLDRWLLGSVAEKVLTASDVPVLVYRAWTPAEDCESL